MDDPESNSPPKNDPEEEPKQATNRILKRTSSFAQGTIATATGILTAAFSVRKDALSHRPALPAWTVPRGAGDIDQLERAIGRDEMPPGPGIADHQAPPAQPPRSPHRGSGAAMPMPQSPLRIKQDCKFYERLLTKESSAANLSFRYYWAEPGAVPFVWESQPGTPKDVARMAAAGALPAITPPPSYLLRHGDGGVGSARHDQKSGSRKRRRRCRIKRIRIGFIAGIFRRLSLGKRWRQRPAATPVKVASSSSRWLFSSVATETGEHNLHQDEIDAVVAAHPKQHKAVPCSFPTLWLLRFRNSSGSRGGRNDGWA